MKQDLEKFKKFSIRRAFKAVDSANLRYIDEAAIRRFLTKLGHKTLKGELIAIMRRFDLDGDAKVSFQEFVEALTPVQPDVVQNPLRNYPERRRNRSASRTQSHVTDELRTATVHADADERDDKRSMTAQTIEYPNQSQYEGSKRKRSIGHYHNPEPTQVYVQDFSPTRPQQYAYHHTQQ